MSGAIIAIVIAAVIIVAGLVAAAALTARRRRLQRQFGPEYERAVTEQNSRLRAEAELTGRQRRVRKLDIRPLSEETREQYAADWTVIQEQFVDSPQTAVGRAYGLVVTVMTERGYPTDDSEQVVADLSVEHAATVGHFRSAQQIASAATSGDVATEDLRQALIHYRALFSDLLGETPDVAPTGTDGTGTDSTDTDSTDTDSTGADSTGVPAAEPTPALSNDPQWR
ncbi:MAG TPA: hypothetical protein VK836_07670 [Streptosporangiaceae bacterium]|nr:hypothetical protein [Streptosporangiaceae bacterium]